MSGEMWEKGWQWKTDKGKSMSWVMSRTFFVAKNIERGVEWLFDSFNQIVYFVRGITET